MIRTRTLRLTLVVGAGIAIALCAVATSTAALSPPATSALDWLEDQIAANGHHLVRASVDGNGDFAPEDDVGLTIDALLAFAAAGRSSDAEVQAAADWVVAHAPDYVSGASIGDADDSRYAGELGKFLLFTQVFDRDAGDAESDLRGLMASNGRFVDRSDFGDLSQGVKQAIDVLALAHTDGGAPSKSVDYLLLQQCPAGGFRIQLADTQCANNADADLDATSFALMALRTLGDDDAFDDGAAYLLSQQTADGGFGGNANSTGLAGSVLQRANAADFVQSLQLTSGDDAGAILLDEDGHDAAVADGLDDATRTIATRATSQGALAFGLPAYDRIGAAAPPTTTTTTIAGATTTSTTTTSTTTSTSVVASTTTTTGRPPSTTTTTSAARALAARTGANSGDELLIGGALLVSGAALVTAARRRRIVYPFKK